MPQMKLRTSTLIALLLLGKWTGVRGVCDRCQPNNSVVCHSETVFSLCVDGTPTQDYITCPQGYVCTEDYYVCYPETAAVASCARDQVAPIQCGVCTSPGKVFACIDATTIAFCFGRSVPNYAAQANCPAGTVCDLSNSKEFCTSATDATPSCNFERTTTTPATDPPTTTTTVAPTTTTTVAPTTTTTVAPTTTTTVAPTTTTTVAPTTTTTAAPTTRAPRDPSTLCKEEQTNTMYGIEGDTECRKYILCVEKTTGDTKAWDAIILKCLQNTYFSGIVNGTAVCGADKPSYCV